MDEPVTLSITPQQAGVIAQELNPWAFHARPITAFSIPADANPVEVQVNSGVEGCGLAGWITILAIPGGSQMTLKPRGECLPAILPLWLALVEELRRLGCVKGDAPELATGTDNVSEVAQRRQRVMRLWKERKGGTVKKFKDDTAEELSVSASTIRDDLAYLRLEGLIE